MFNILLVEDDKNIREMIYDYFTAKGNGKYQISLAGNGQQGIEMAYENSFDLLLLDVMLPEIDGFEICRQVRRYSDVPIMFITARVSEEDMLRGYGLGCDDYIIKPFKLPVLFEKTKALIKRSKGLVRFSILRAGDISLNPNNGIVICDGEELSLKAKEFGILKILLENKNKVVSRTLLVSSLWDYNEDVDDRILDSQIRNLRKSLGDSAKHIKTIIKRGYMLEDK